MRKKDLRGEHAYITGAGDGIGREVALILAKQGVLLTLTDINLVSAEQTAALVRDVGGKAIAL